jgi:hypothetical protein
LESLSRAVRSERISRISAAIDTALMPGMALYCLEAQNAAILSVDSSYLFTAAFCFRMDQC